eukprot:jgi/Chrzof1/2127/Cz11g03170.t1
MNALRPVPPRCRPSPVFLLTCHQVKHTAVHAAASSVIATPAPSPQPLQQLVQQQLQVALEQQRQQHRAHPDKLLLQPSETAASILPAEEQRQPQQHVPSLHGQAHPWQQHADASQSTHTQQQRSSADAAKLRLRRQKALTTAIMQADHWQQLRQLVDLYETSLNPIHLTAMLRRLAWLQEHGAPGTSHEQREFQELARLLVCCLG